MEALVFSTAVIALAEMGDKTQLLAFVLAAKFRRRVPIMLAILVATVANHTFAGFMGVWLARLLSPDALRWSVALLFIACGAWALRPDRLDGRRGLSGSSVFFVSLTAFFLMEIGDKTQLATVILAARYGSLAVVVAGTTLGMMLANLPAVWTGEALAQKVKMSVMRWLAAFLFAVLGILTLLAGDGAVRVP